MWQASEMLEMIKRDATYGIYPHVDKFNFTELVDNREKYIDFYTAYQKA